MRRGRSPGALTPAYLKHKNDLGTHATAQADVDSTRTIDELLTWPMRPLSEVHDAKFDAV